MSERYDIEVSDEAKIDLSHYTAFERKIIVSGIRQQLTHQPRVETKNRKRLRDNPVASWALRVGKYRVFYEVIEPTRLVNVVSIGHKDHNTLLIRGKEVRL
jgi:mRNA interferase RelE/StbE